MKFLALEKPVSGAPTDIPASVLEDEARAAWALYREGVVRELYFRADRREAALLLECTEEQARTALASLPLVGRGYIGFDLLPLVPYDGFARLFAIQEGRGLPLPSRRSAGQSPPRRGVTESRPAASASLPSYPHSEEGLRKAINQTGIGAAGAGAGEGTP